MSKNPVNRETIRLLSQLCRINCTEEEETQLMADLGNILSYFESLDEIETDEEIPCHILKDVKNVMRDDLEGDKLPRDVFLANAPAHTGGMIRVPPVIKGR